MRVPLIVPDLGPVDERLIVSGWFVDVGELVLAGDLVAELLIPGVSFDVIAEKSGRLAEIARSVDSLVSAGDVLGWLEETPTDAN